MSLSNLPPHHVSRSTTPSNSTITSPTPASLHRIQNSPCPVLEKIGDVADGVAVGQEVPAPGSVAVVVQPGSEYEVGRRAEKDAEAAVSFGYI